MIYLSRDTQEIGEEGPAIVMAETRERILAAAEQLFGEQGFAATSLRAVTSAAGVNLAAVNYKGSVVRGGRSALHAAPG